MRIADAHAPLLGRVDQKDPAERPECLAAQRLLGLLIENDDPLSGFDEFGSGDQSGEPGSDNDRIGVIRHAFPSPIRKFSARAVAPD